MTAKTCTNKGCGRQYSDQDNSDTACTHHPGAPVFHEGLKGWSCCSKRVTDFDDFLKIAGCGVGAHSDAKPKPVEKPQHTEVMAPTTMTSDGKEVYGAVAPATAAVTPHAAPAATPSSLPAPPPPPKEEELNDPEGCVVEIGAKCRRGGCGKSLAEGTERTGDECVFHSGTPIFHEGSKGWSCCNRKVLEFDEFLKIQGCKRGRHRFTDQSPVQERVQCRHDWYQTPTTVILSVFAKKADKELTKVTFGPQDLKVDVKFQDGKFFELHTPLALPIVPENCKYTVMGTKVEIVLAKANGLSWPSLEPQENVVSWTTFGAPAGSGTIGSKEALVAQDAPLHLLNSKS